MAETRIKIWSKDDSYRVGSPYAFDKNLLTKVNYEYLRPFFAGNFGWRVGKKLADGYLYLLDDFDQKLVSNIRLKEGEKIYRYFNEKSAIGGITPLIKINTSKGLAYFMQDTQTDEVNFDSRGIKLEWLNLIEGGKMNDGGVVKGKFLKQFVLNEASSGMIANKTSYSSYKDIDGVRLAAIQILMRDGDREYSVKAFSDLIKEAADEYAENKHEGKFASGGTMSKKHTVSYDKMQEMYVVKKPDGSPVDEFINKRVALQKAKDLNSKFAKGGKTKMSPEAIFEQYEENEDENYHSENVVLLATYFGTADDLKKAKEILEKHEAANYLSEDLNKERYELSQKLYPKLIASMRNKMGNGGISGKQKDLKDALFLMRYNNLTYADGKWKNTGKYGTSVNASANLYFTQESVNKLAERLNSGGVSKQMVMDYMKSTTDDATYKYWSERLGKGGIISVGNKVKVKDTGKTFKVEKISKNAKGYIEFSGKAGSYLKGDIDKMARGGRLKTDDYVWNAAGKKLVVDKVTDTEYYLVGFGQPSASPFLKSKVDKYIEQGQWTLKAPKYAKGGMTDECWCYNVGGL